MSDESVVEQWAKNAYYQYFSGGQVFKAKAPCEASELVHFRKRIGVEGVKLNYSKASVSMEKEAKKLRPDIVKLPEERSY
ncbi:transposase [Pedobacter sp. MR2016-19]|uniref:transposase n=1 Tax=Pedobacter sp. MR2016-19 TaxID=2780089 RepID=UPI002102BBFE|nr:transposase [Pedobacter sp. MR2016-19]